MAAGGHASAGHIPRYGRWRVGCILRTVIVPTPASSKDVCGLLRTGRGTLSPTHDGLIVAHEQTSVKLSGRRSQSHTAIHDRQIVAPARVKSDAISADCAHLRRRARNQTVQMFSPGRLRSTRTPPGRRTDPPKSPSRLRPARSAWRHTLEQVLLFVLPTRIG
jgi:hypothetical protein